MGNHYEASENRFIFVNLHTAALCRRRKKGEMKEDKMEKTEKYKLLGVLIRGFFEAFASGIIDSEVQDAKDILVLQNAFEKTRKQMKVNTLSINALSDNLSFPMFAKLTLKKT